MTVSNVVSILANAKEIYIDSGEESTLFNPRDVIMADAYGSYLVNRLYAIGENCFMIGLAVRPVKEETV